MHKYKKVKVVGKGSFGYAMLVQSIVDKKLYVMKIIDVSKMDPKQKEEALNEIHVLKALRHPYIVTYRESFIEQRCLCIVMDFADGGDLYTSIAQQKKLNQYFLEEQVIEWFIQMGLALKHVHDRKILHRDIKTQNIFLTSKGEVKLGDFGISRVLKNTQDCAKTAIGTPYYLSPEICQEQPYNQKSDIWSLGCILYEMITLHHAFDSNNMRGLVVKILKNDPKPIPHLFTEELQKIVNIMLIKDPSSRPSINKILEMPFLKEKIEKLIYRTKAKMGIGVSSSLDEGPLQHFEHRQKIEEERKSEGFDKINVRLSQIRERGKSPAGRMQLENIVHNFEERGKGGNKRMMNNYMGIKGSKSTSSGGEENNTAQYIPQHTETNNTNRGGSRFLTPEGEEIFSTRGNDGIAFQLENLRIYLETQMGDLHFVAAYKYLRDRLEKGASTQFKAPILPESKSKYLPLIDELIINEDQFFADLNQQTSKELIFC